MGIVINPMTPAQLNAADTAQWKSTLKQALYDLRVAAPAIVKSYDSATNTVVVQVAVSELVRKNYVPVFMAIWPIFKVPVVLPSSGGFSITLPLQSGDEGLLVFCDQCIDAWWENGGIQPPDGAILPQPNFERRRHDITDCGFIPGMRSQPRLLQNYSTTSMQLRSDDGTVVIDVAEAGVTITAPKTQIVTTGDSDVSASGNVNMTGNAEVNLNAQSEISLTAPSIALNGIVSGGSF
jgi:hypothetical protein